MAGALAEMATNSEEVHQRLQRSSNRRENRFRYFGFNVPRDIGDVGLGDWNRCVELATHTSNYMREAEAERLRALCVQFLLSALARTTSSTADIGTDVASYNFTVDIKRTELLDCLSLRFIVG